MQQENITIIGQKLNFKVLLLLLIANPLISVAQQPYEGWDTNSEELIDKEIITHRIVKQELVDLIIEYDNMYSPYLNDLGRGISILRHDTKKTTVYYLDYTIGIGSNSPILVCEPINGREVHVTLLDLHHEVQLPYPRSVELLKRSNRKQYKSFRRGQREMEEMKENGLFKITTTGRFVTWSITFDKNTGKFLRKSTPDQTKQLQKISNMKAE